MRQFNRFKGTKGWISTWERVIRFRDMINQRAQHKALVLGFWRKHGVAATSDAYGVSRATLYRWTQKLRDGNGALEVLNGNTTPHNRRRRAIDPRVESYLIEMRTKHPRIGKKKLGPLLRKQCVIWERAAPCESTVGRILTDLKTRNLLPSYTRMTLYGKTGTVVVRKQPKKRKKQRRNGYQPEKAGELLELDTVVYFINGIRRYLISAVDLHGRFAFAHAYKNPSSASATDFLKKLETVAPFPLVRLQTDNGSEFEKNFRRYVEDNRLIHFHTYPRHPKQNAHIERFNRTIQEEFANGHREILAYDLAAFNKALMDWLLWYNTERPHEALGLLSPLQFLVSMLSTEESHVWWTRTKI